jgi:hypothetical protein
MIRRVRFIRYNMFTYYTHTLEITYTEIHISTSEDSI